MNTSPEASHGYFLRRLSFLMMLFPALLTGCATTAIINHATPGEPVYEEITPVRLAYRTPAGDLILCTARKAGQPPIEHPFSLHVTAKQMQRSATDCGYRGHLTELPHSTIRPGWPDATAISRNQLTAVPVGTAQRGLAVGSDADAFRNHLAVVEGAPDTLYNITGYGSGQGSELVYIRRDEDKHIALTLRPGTIRPHLTSLCFLPVGILIDGTVTALTIGSLFYSPAIFTMAIVQLPEWTQEVDKNMLGKPGSR
jgi:hypothetical protein